LFFNILPPVTQHEEWNCTEYDDMPIGTIETIIQVILELVYGRADGMPSFLQSVVLQAVSGQSLSGSHFSLLAASAIGN
jgi:hypothetical protein